MYHKFFASGFVFNLCEKCFMYKDLYAGLQTRVHKTMKGTEVPNPRPSSACDCTCVLTRIDHCLVTLSCLPCTCLCKVRSRISDTLSQALCNLSLAFLADFTLSDSALISFIHCEFDYWPLAVSMQRCARSVKLLCL